MIFISNKEIWDIFVEAHQADMVSEPTEFPCYLFISGEREGENVGWGALYKSDFRSMIDKINDWPDS